MSAHVDSRKRQWREIAKRGDRDEIAGFVGKLLVCLDQAENERDIERTRSTTECAQWRCECCPRYPGCGRLA